MSLRGDSYGSVEQVRALTRHLLDGQTNFNSTTRPTLTDVEAIVDRVSGSLNTALAGQGFSTPIANSTAVLACSDWVVMVAARQVELTQRGTGWNGEDGSRMAALDVGAEAWEWAEKMAKALKNMGVGGSSPSSEGLTFTGLTAQALRVDPLNEGYEQPHFRRRQFDYPGGTGA